LHINIVVVITIIISFVVLLNCHYLSPQVLLFPVLLPILPEGVGVSERLCGPNCQLPG